MIELLIDVIGKNTKGEICHPYMYQRGPMSGRFVYTLSCNESFESADETSLRALIESGLFNRGGRIRMIPKSARTTASASALNVISYKGKPVA